MIRSSFPHLPIYKGFAHSPWGGSAVALFILLAWVISFFHAFATGVSNLGPLGCGLLIPWFTFLYTGLFVTGHDAMHQSIAPNRPRLNRALGEIALFIYGFIPYDKLCEAHANHHLFPASHRDPDFHDGTSTHPVLWYFRFMRSYWTLRQTVSIVVVYNSLYRILGVPEANLLVFWAIPSLLSSMQLFYFGTYLVHRHLPNTHETPLRANSNYWPRIISLITCYHFGYHREHHAFPEVPWWRLPEVRFEACLAQPHATVNRKCVSSVSMLATVNRPLVALTPARSHPPKNINARHPHQPHCQRP